MDRRIKYTKTVIRETLLELMENKDATKITVTEICEKADINRATFYKYYLDVYDLIKQIEDELIEELKKSLTIEIKNMNLENIIFNIMTIIYDNEDLCRVLLNNNSNKEFLINILYYARDTCFGVWRKEFTHMDETLFNYMFMYSSNGVIAIMQLWLKNGCRESIEEITKIITEMVRKGNSVLIN